MAARYGLAAFDMDGTLVDHSSTWAIVHEHFGESNEEAVGLYLSGRIDDYEFMRRDIGLWLRGGPLTFEDVKDVLRPMPLFHGIKETVDALHAQGTICVIVSGGLEAGAEIIAELAGFDAIAANGVEVGADGFLTGEGLLKVDISDKSGPLKRFQEAYGVSRERTVSIGNSYVDISMFEVSGLGIAFNPIDRLVEDRADHVVRSKDIRGILPFILG